VLINRMVVSFHGGSPFQGFVTPILFRIRGTAASTSNYEPDTISRDRDLPLTAKLLDACVSIGDGARTSLVRIFSQAGLNRFRQSVPSPIRSCGMPATKQRFGQGSRRELDPTLFVTIPGSGLFRV
jgi:hypothetical protein